MGLPSDWKTFPRSPGVYIMGDGRGKVLYVGKAKDLRTRVRNYSVPGGDGRPSIPNLVARVREIRCIVTATEKEALLLENTLIKRHRPPFNIFFRDDKEYLLLRIDRNEEFPRPELVRKAARDGATYFGPFSSARGIRETLRELLRLFPLCSCTRRKFASRTRPCLNYQMGRCLGACAGLISREQYLPVVDDAVRFLRGEYRGLLARWKTEMKALSGGMRFEEAAKIRDRIAVVSKTLARQRVVRTVAGDVDAVGWHRDGPAVTAADAFGTLAARFELEVAGSHPALGVRFVATQMGKGLVDLPDAEFTFELPPDGPPSLPARAVVWLETRYLNLVRGSHRITAELGSRTSGGDAEVLGQTTTRLFVRKSADPLAQLRRLPHTWQP